MTKPRRDSPVTGEPASDPAYRSLALHAIQARDSERAALSRFLHDDIAQCLSGIGLQLDILKMDLEDRVPEIGARTAEIQKILEEVVTRIRDLSSDLNPQIVERAGLRVALDLLAGRFRRIFPGRIRLLFSCENPVLRPLAEVFYRVAELAVDNAVTHSQGDLVEILFRETRRGVVLEVRDNGRGFECDKTFRGGEGLGFAVMQYYAAKAGLKLSIVSRLGEGSIVKISQNGRPSPSGGDPSAPDISVERF